IILLFVTFTARKLLFARFKVLLKNIFENYKPTLYRHSGKRGTSASRIKPQKNGSWTSPSIPRYEGSRDQDYRKQINLNRYLDQGFISFEHIGRIYRKLLDRILSNSKNRKRVIIIVILFSIFSYILVPLGFVRNEFFPKSNQNYLYVNIELPAGTNLDVAEKETLFMLNQLRETKGVLFVSANIGLGLNQGGAFLPQGFNNILFSLVLEEKEHRKLSSIDIAEKLRNKYKTYAKGNFSVTEASGGPPAGADVQIKLFGDDLGVLDSLADKLILYLKTQPGLDNIDKSIKPGTSKIVFLPDKDKITEYGLSIDTIGFWLRTYVSGFSTVNIKLEGSTDSKDITIRTSSTEQFAETITNLSIPTPNGNIPISSLGTFSVEANPTIITREDGKRTISVIASARKGFSVSVANQKLQKYADTLNLPQGYSWSTGGANEENQKSVNSILQAMLLSFLLILVTMVLQFNSFRRAFIVMLVIPLSISGVFIIFALFHIPLSFPALIGVLALFGIVVKNAILIVDKIMANIKAGLDYKYAIIDGAESRLEPIALTSFAAILGLVPITLSNALWQGLGGAIIAGLLFSGSIMLFFIPVVYYIMFNTKKK
ncbi:MAG: efflux RND transporter permease subunit, partial [Candidatus Levybacteria bacterium]|nr:efflux RND transporter permease subunit [Candidatus Levybacteria bacterium]